MGGYPPGEQVVLAVYGPLAVVAVVVLVVLWLAFA